MKRNHHMISKATARKLQKLFQAFMHEIGAKESDCAFYEYELQTPLGFLLINAPTADYGTIFCRFDEPEKTRGKLALACNPYTGKWNFHPSKDAAAEMLSCFIHNVRCVMQTPG